MRIRFTYQDRAPVEDAREDDMEPVLEDLEWKIVQALHKTGEDCHKINANNTKWTDQIKQSLGELANGKRCLQFPNKRTAMWEKGGEWLFDVVWFHTGADEHCADELDWRQTKSLTLIAESEWGTQEYMILEDFLKLVFCDADHRLFIYTNTSIKTADGGSTTAVELCKNACRVANRDVLFLALGFPQDRNGILQVDAWGQPRQLE